MHAEQESGRKAWLLLRLSAVIAVACFVLGYNAGPLTLTSRPATTELKTVSKTKASSNTIEINVYNYYTKTSPPIQGYPWSIIAEPYRTTTIEVTNPDEDKEYTIWVDDHVQGYGTSVDVAFTSLGTHTIQVVATNRNGHETSQDFEVMVKYVRRELRSLTDRDREAFFQTVMTLQRVPTVVGQELYGSGYFSKDYFNRIHLYYGGLQDCDHWHTGPGFVTSHFVFTLMYEKALQAVNPTVTVPYWDFTLESTFYQAGTWQKSAVFAPDWFGEASPTNDLQTVTEGRFAYIPAMTNAQEFSILTNSYGVLRAPWNNDPTPFYTRCGNVYGMSNNLKPSGCTEYYRAFYKDTWESFSIQLNSAAHGHLHELMGGSWNHPFVEFSSGHTEDALYTFAHLIEMLSKDLWRAGYLSCPETCDISNTPASECKCECTAEAWAMDPRDVLYNSGALEIAQFYDDEFNLIETLVDDDGYPLDQIDGYTVEETDNFFSMLRYYLCDPGHIGSMFQATSTNDPTFWVLHPTMERMWHLKRLGNDSSYNETWSSSYDCYGHNPADMQPFIEGLFGESEVGETPYYTNEELYDLLDPANPNMPYIYDNFLYPHCELLGMDITNSVLGDS